MKPRPLRILMTTDAVGGVWTYAVELCRALPDVEFLLANMGPPPNAAQARELAGCRNVGLAEGGYALEWQDDPWDDIAAAGRWLLDLEASCSPDAIHLNGYVHAALPWKAPVVAVAHSCVLSWWRAVRGQPAPARWARYADAVRRGLHAADRVVAPSCAMARALEEHYGFRGAEVIGNGRDGRELRPDGRKRPFILCAGRLWDEAKNVRCLAAAADGLAWPLVLAGQPGNAGGEFANVAFLGKLDRPRMAGLFRDAAVYAHPARYEPFGLAPLEAALAECALVLADIPSLREIWGNAAEYVPPDHPGAWRETLAALISKPAARAELACRARLRASRFTPRRMGGGYLGLYRELTQQPSVAAS